MNMDEALQTFFAECAELLQQMEEALLRVEREDDKTESINAIFRAAHTIKGSAGLFGLDHVVAFTHVLESVLDRVRHGELELNEELVAHFLEGNDHIGLLLEQIAAGGATPDADTIAAGAVVLDKLRVYMDTPAAPAQSQPVTVAAPAPVTASPTTEIPSRGAIVDSDQWHISLRFGRDVLRNGLDPLSFIRYLGTMGRIAHIETIADALPPAAEMDPESCYLGFEIGFVSDADKARIEGVFDFVRDDCAIQILPPRSQVSAYSLLLAKLPEEDLRIGEMLVSCGTLTSRELEAALATQAAEPADAGRSLGEILVGQNAVQAAVVDAAADKQKQVKERKQQEASFLRIDAEKLDTFINLIGELVIAGAATGTVAQRSGSAELLESASTLSRLVEEVRDSALQLRMVQIGATFNRFQRVVRDVSKELGKDIELEIEGAETELDKTVVEKIADPLTHLVRNSMDHGIESAEVRLAGGKPPRGKLKLSAHHESGSIVIEVSDDGGGLNRDRILKKAIEKGIVAPGAQLSDREIYKLIFEAGFSTAEQVTNLSGRGVGMDVVRRNIDALRGSIELDSVMGRGTTVKIRLPLTLAIIDGFAVTVGKSSFIVPLDMMVECIELTEAHKAAAGPRNYVNLRGEVLPFVRLRELYEFGPVETGARLRENIVVVQFGAHKAGLVVDSLLGEYQAVIKPLAPMFSHIRSISGSTIFGNGEVALILDVPGLVAQAMEQEQKALLAA